MPTGKILILANIGAISLRLRDMDAGVVEEVNMWSLIAETFIFPITQRVLITTII